MAKSFSPPLMIGLAAAGAQAFLAQAGTPWTLWPGLALAFWAIWKFHSWDQPRKILEKSLPPRTEVFLFLGILLMGFFFRVYRLSEIPVGLPADQGFMGLSAMWIIRDGWNPFPIIYRTQVPDLFPPLALSLWFRLVDPTLLGFRLFFVALSLATFPLVYWTFRQLGGPRVALLTLFFFAAMRWDWVLVHNSQPSLETNFFLFGTLAFFLHGLKDRSAISLAASGLFCGAGLYAYPALKVVPLLLLVLGLFEMRKTSKGPTRSILLGPLLLAVLLSLPLLQDMALHGLPGREGGDFILKKVLAEKSLRPLWDVWTGTALMFNRSGDPSPWYNTGGRRMLDDVTGTLFLLGLAWAWRKRRERAGFLSLSGLLFMALPCLLSVSPAASHRLAGLTPFVAFLSAQGLLDLLNRLFPPGKKRVYFLPVLALLLASSVLQNAWTYFGIQAKDPAYHAASQPSPTRIALEIAGLEKERPGKFDHWVDPELFRHPTLRFLTWNWMDRVGGLELSAWAKRPRPGQPSSPPMNAALYLDGSKRGAPGFLMGLFPGSSLEPLQDDQGRILATRVLIPHDALEKAPAWDRGLKGEYSWPGSGGDKWAMADRIDPIVDFAHDGDFYYGVAPFRVRWTGTLEIARTGKYQFQVLSSDLGDLWLDGKPVALEMPLSLRAGSHPLRLDFEKKKGFYPAFFFIWKKPGDANWEVVLATAFGKPPN